MLTQLKTTVTVIFFLTLQNSYAQKVNSLYDQLIKVNREWKDQKDVDPFLKINPTQHLTDWELIKIHLQETEKLLRKRNVSHLSNSQQKSREANLATLYAYWQKGVFPVNDKHLNRQPYFIDKYDTYCAVGYLMKQSGADDVARDISRTQNYSFLLDISHPNLMNWITASGLTLGELALIQPGYPGEWPCAIMEFHYNNIGIDVNEYIEIHESSETFGLPLRTVLFYNENGNLYRTLPVTEMKSYPYTHYSSTGNARAGKVYYYNFSSAEPFADKGKIELVGKDFNNDNKVLSVTTYNDVSVVVKDNYVYGNSATRTFNIGENENTAVNTSLTYCGFYNSANWTLQSLPATIGYQNACTVMPVGLINFSSGITNGKVNLSWATALEANNDFFEIERSTDAGNFKAIGKVEGAGNSNAVQRYTFTDNAPNYINHYRLKQVDADGKFSYSKNLFVKVEDSNPLFLNQNVISNSLQLKISLRQNDLGALIIYDFTGRETLRYNAKSGSQSVDVAGLTAGRYLVRLYTIGGQVYNQIFIKR